MIYIAIIILGLAGIILCLKIYTKKKAERPLVCMLGADCNTVLKSDFSKFLGIGLEIFGFIYYGIVTLSYLALFLFPQLQTPLIYFILLGLSMGAFLFSMYLIAIQAFVLRSWCSWCLISAGLSTLILIITFIGATLLQLDFVPILSAIKHPLVMIHLIGFALGVGGATINDVMFFRFLKDYRISHEENEVLKIMSQVIWFGLALSIISGFGLYLQNIEALNESSKFLLKVVVVGVITLNGVFLNLSIAPHLVKLSFKDSSTKTSQATHLRKLAFASGAISFVSWYTAFFLGTIKSLPFTFIQLISIYVVLLTFAVIGSLIMEKMYCTKSPSTNTD